MILNQQTLTTSVTVAKATCPCVLLTFLSKPTSLCSFVVLNQQNLHFFIHTFSSAIPPWNKFPPRN